MSEMKIKALAPWFGGKRNLAPQIIEALGPHKTYWDPFCGSMAVLMAKPPCVMETVNDLHRHIINLAEVLQDEKTALELYKKTSRTLMAEELYAAARIRLFHYEEGRINRDEYSPIDRAYDFLLVSWLGRNGVAGTSSNNYGFCLRFTANGGHAATRWQSVSASIPAWHKRLANVTILNRDAFKLLERIGDEAGTAIYIDPPYLVKGSKYVHDFEESDHQRLAELLHRFKAARVVVSYYDHPKLAELYPNWRRIEIPVTKSLVSQGKRDKNNKVRVLEVLLVNQDTEKLFV